MVYYPQIEICLELENMIGTIHFDDNSPDEVEKQHKRYIKKQFGVFL